MGKVWGVCCKYLGEKHVVLRPHHTETDLHAALFEREKIKTMRIIGRAQIKLLQNTHHSSPSQVSYGMSRRKESSDYSASCTIKQMTITKTLLTQHTIMQNPPRSRLHLYKHPDMQSNQSNFTIATRIHRVSIPWYYIHIGVHISLWGVCISPIRHRGGHVTTCVKLTGVEWLLRGGVLHNTASEAWAERSGGHICSEQQKHQS